MAQVLGGIRRRQLRAVPCTFAVAAVALAACAAWATVASIAGFIQCPHQGAAAAVERLARPVYLRHSGRSSIQMSAAAEAKVDTFDPWTVLELSPGVGMAEAKKRYKKMITKYHPDVDPSPEAEERMSRIVRAYAVISGEDKQLDQGTLLKNAVENLRNDLEFKKARIEALKQEAEEEMKNLEEMQERFETAKTQKTEVDTQSAMFGGAALGALALGPTGLVLGAVAGLAFKDNDDSVGQVVKGTGNLAKMVIDGVGGAIDKSTEKATKDTSEKRSS